MDKSVEILPELRGMFRYLVLYAIDNLKKAHGYEIRRYLRTSLKFYIPSTGILYPTLHKLEKEGVLTSYREGRRKVYELTEYGRKLLERDREKIYSYVTKLRYAMEILERLNLNRLLNIIKILWENNIVLQPDVIESIREKVDEIIEILSKAVPDLNTS